MGSTSFVSGQRPVEINFFKSTLNWRKTGSRDRRAMARLYNAAMRLLTADPHKKGL